MWPELYYAVYRNPKWAIQQWGPYVARILSSDGVIYLRGKEPGGSEVRKFRDSIRLTVFKVYITVSHSTKPPKASYTIDYLGCLLASACKIPQQLKKSHICILHENLHCRYVALSTKKTHFAYKVAQQFNHQLRVPTSLQKVSVIVCIYTTWKALK